MKSALLQWSAVLFALLIVLIIILADVGGLGFLRFINRIPFGDKIGNFLLYGILTLLLDLALFRSLPGLDRRLLSLRIAFILALLVGLEEFSQLFFPNRSFDLVDLAFSYLGVIFFSWVALRTKQ